MSKPDDPTSAPPSLLEAESRGGDINEGGLNFQMAVLLTYVPGWLAIEGFTMLIREAVGDFEAQFFVPGTGYAKEFLEAKDHAVTPAEFWREIARFRDFDRAKQREFQWYTLVSAGLSTDLHPLANGLRRLRNPYGFYGPDSAIVEKSYADYLAIVTKMGHSEAEAEFLFRKVSIESDWSTARESGRALFRDALCKELPSFHDVSSRVIDDTYAALTTFVRSRRNEPVERRELEVKLREFLPAEERSSMPAIRMHTAFNETNVVPRNELVFRWEKFFGREQRSYPLAADWNNVLVRELRDTKQWTLKHRSTRRIRLSGNRRLSASIAFGYKFSAVAGFVINMVSRDEVIWATDAHAKADTPAYSLATSGSSQEERGKHLVISIGIPRDISAEVEEVMSQLGLKQAPTIHLHGAGSIISAEQANLIVAEVKRLIASAVRDTGARTLHLFIAGPAFLALLLGHRLNATAPVQCYEWVGSGNYVPTCWLD